MTQPTPKRSKKADLRPASPSRSTAITIPEGVNVEGDLKIKPIESNSDRLHRHRMEVRDFWVKQAPIHLVAILILVGSTLLAMIWAFRPGSAAEDKKWAVSVLSSLLIATAGFAFGKAAG